MFFLADDFDEEDVPRRKKKGGARGFWSLQRIAFVAVFVTGIILGYYIAVQLSSVGAGEQKAAELQKINQELDALNDKYYSCLQSLEIDPQGCTK